MTIRSNRRANPLSRAVSVTMEQMESRMMLTAVAVDPIVVTLPNRPLAATAVVGRLNSMSPQMVRNAYSLDNIYFNDPLTGQTIQGDGSGQTIAIVDAFGDPTIMSDVVTFDKQWNLPNTSADGNFFLSVAEPFGVASGVDPFLAIGWSEETSLDVEWAHAMAPRAHIDLVVVTDQTLSTLIGGDIYAASLPGVSIVSNSWGYPDGDFSNFDSDFVTPAGHNPVLFMFSSGDSGTVSYPSTSVNVLSVGGTTLDVTSNGSYLGETPWFGSGGGTSGFETSGGNFVTTPDISWNADPASGVWIYNKSVFGWIPHVGGTSESCPALAGLIAVANQGRSMVSEPTLDLADVQNVIANDLGDFHHIVTFEGFDNVGVGSPIAPLFVNDLVGNGITGLTGGDHLAFIQQPIKGSAGTGISPGISVALEDANGNIVANNGTVITLDLYQAPVGATTIFGTFNSITVNGVATFSDTILQTSGTYQFEAVDSVDAPGFSQDFSITAGAPAKLVFLNQPTTSWQYGPVSPGVKVAIEDIFGNIVSAARTRVKITLDSGPGNLVGAGNTGTARNGVALIGGVNVDTPGTYTLLATDGILAQAISDAYQVVPLPAATQSFLFSGISLSPGFKILRERRIALQLVEKGVMPIL